MRRLTVLAALLAAVLVLAACERQEPEVAEEDQVPEDMVADDEEPADDEEDVDADADETIEFLAGDMYFEELPDSVAAGTIEFVMENEGSADHDLVIEELGDQEVVPLTSGGETASGTVALEPGTYTLYCSVPGHREATMEVTLEVE